MFDDNHEADSARAFEIFKLHLEVGYLLNGFAGVQRQANEFCNSTASKLGSILSTEAMVDGQQVLAKAADSYSITGIESLRRLQLELKRANQPGQERSAVKAHAVRSMDAVLVTRIRAVKTDETRRKVAKTPSKPTPAEIVAFHSRQREKRDAKKMR